MEENPIPFSTFTEAQTFAILVATFISSSASILGALFIIINTIRLKKVKILFWRMLTCLSCTDLLLSIAEWIGVAEQLAGYDIRLCKLQGFFMMFEHSSNFYTLSIAICIYLMVIKKIFEWNWKIELIVHISLWSVQFLIAATPLFGTSIHFAPAGAWCWLAPKPVYARFLLSYAIVWTIMLVIIMIYIRLWIFVKRPPLVVIVNAEKYQHWRRLFIQLFMFPLVFIIVWTPSAMARVQQAIQNKPNFVLVFLQCLFLPLQGILNAVIYGLTSNILQQLPGPENFKPLLSNTVVQ